MPRTSIYRLLALIALCFCLLFLATWPGRASMAGTFTVYLPALSVFKYPPPLQAVLVATGIPADTVTDIASVGDGRLYAVQRQGVIRIIEPDGTVRQLPFLDIFNQVEIGNWEQGMLGLAFHPDYPAVPYFYVSYTSRTLNRIHISRFTVSPDSPDRVDPNTQLILLAIDKTLPDSPVHNGGDLVFGPDGYLYIAVGDGGPDPQFGSTVPHDPGDHGYRTDVLLGKILRIDVNGGGYTPPDINCGAHRNYTIPPGNPFADGAGPNCDEIWAKGLRNPWRFSFDRQTGDMFVTDVGEWLREEVNFAPAGTHGGRDYGWRCFEGTYDHRLDHPELAFGCAPDPMEDYTFPVYEYDQTAGCSVVGGFVYRGNDFPALRGHYIFGDYCNGALKVLSPTANGDWILTASYGVGFHISTFGEDTDGEIYIGRWHPGGPTAVYRLVALPTQ